MAVRNKIIPINCGVPMTEEYACFVSDNQFNSFFKRKCEDLAFQSWQVMFQVNPLCENYHLYKHRLEFERYLKIIRGPERVKLTTFRCSSAALPTVEMVLRKSFIETCPLCGSYCVPDKYHLLLNCRFVSAKRQEFLPIYY